MRIRTGAAAAAVAVAAAFAGLADAAAPVACEGTVQLTGTSNVEARAADGQTFVEFDFTGIHTLCLADGTEVSGTVAGHLAQKTNASGDGTLRFDEILTYDGSAPAAGTLSYRGQASFAGDGSKWQGHVRTVGQGTGVLAGIHGQGEFWPTGPTSFGDRISYVYPR